MRRHAAAAGLATTIGIAAACGGSGAPDAPVLPTGAPYRAEVEAWRAKHEASYRQNYATIAGLHRLKTGANTAGSAATNAVVLPAPVPAVIGRFVLGDDGVRFEPEPGAPVRLRDAPVTAPLALRDDSGSEYDELVIGDVRVVVHASGDERMIRVRDPNGPLATGFLGFSWFPIDEQYRVVGRWIADARPEPVKVPNTFGDLDEFSTEGVAEFTLLGETVRLRPFTTRPNRLWFVFRDGSSGQETYEAARFLYADLRDDGSVVLDFNEAYNPPCAFNPYTTCPIPLPENRLTSVRILAGEKAYPVEVPLGIDAP